MGSFNSCPWLDRTSLRTSGGTMKTKNPFCLRRVLAAMGIASLCLVPAWGQAKKNAPAGQGSAEYAKLATDTPTPVTSANNPIAVSDHYLIGNEDVLAINVWK